MKNIFLSLLLSAFALVLSACDGDSNTVEGGQTKQSQPGKIQLSMARPFIGEGKSESVTVTLTQTQAAATTMRWQTVMGAGRLQADTGAVIVPAGQASATFTIALPDDSLYQGDQVARLSIADEGGKLGSAEIPVNLADDEQMPFVSIEDSESGRASRMDLRVSLSGASGVDTVVDWRTVDATAKAGTDYVAASGSLIIPAGARSGVVSVNTTAGAADSAFVVQLISSPQARIADGSASANIRVGATLDALVGFALTEQTIAEGTSSAGIEFTLSKATGKDVTVNFALGGTATAPGDFTDSAHTVTIPAGQVSAVWAFNVTNDSIFEKSEVITVDLTGAVNAGFGTITHHEVKITDNDPMPLLSIQDAQVTEGQVLTFAVTLDKSSGADTWFTYKTVAGTATEADYAAISGTVVIPKGSTVATVQIPTTADAQFEDREAFTVVISQAGGATLAKGSATATILDDDTMPTIAFTTSVQQIVSTNNTVTVEVELSEPSGSAVTVPFTVAGNSTPGTDHNVAPSVFTIPAGQMHAELTFNLFTHGPPQKSILIELTSPSNATLGLITQQTILF